MHCSWADFSSLSQCTCPASSSTANPKSFSSSGGMSSSWTAFLFSSERVELNGEEKRRPSGTWTDRRRDME